MNVDSYSDLQEFEFPIGIGPQENIVAAEEFTSKQLRIPSIIFSTIS